MTWSGASSGEHFLASNPPPPSVGPDPWYDVTNVAYGAKGDGVTDDGAAIRAAVLLAGPVDAGQSKGPVFLPGGNFVINSADANNNGLTLIANNANFKGASLYETTITIAKSGLAWGIAIKHQNSKISDFYINVTATTAPYWVVGQTATAGVAAEHCKLDDVYVNYSPSVTTIPVVPGGTSIMGAGGVAIGPDSPGTTTFDPANTEMNRVTVFNQSGLGGLSALIHGNGTAGNVLALTALDVSVVLCDYGIQLGGSGVRWYGGGFSQNLKADIYVQQGGSPTGGNDAVYFSGIRGELGNQVLTTTDQIVLRSGLVLDGCSFYQYTPSGAGVAAGELITWMAQAVLLMTGGFYSTQAANTNITLNKNSHAYLSQLVSVGVCIDNIAPYPAASAFLRRTIIGASYMSGSAPAPNPNFTCVVDGVLAIAPPSITMGDGTTAATPVLHFNYPAGQAGQIRWSWASVAKWQLYNNQGDGNLYIRDLVNSLMVATFTPGAGTASIAAFGGKVQAAGTLVAQKDFTRSRQTPTEAVLVSGVDATAGELVSVTLTAARVVGAPLNPAIGQRMVFTLIQGGAGAFAVTWNTVFKKTWADTGNATGTRSSIAFLYDGTNWNQDGAQAPYV